MADDDRDPAEVRRAIAQSIAMRKENALQSLCEQLGILYDVETVPGTIDTLDALAHALRTRLGITLDTSPYDTQATRRAVADMARKLGLKPRGN